MSSLPIKAFVLALLSFAGSGVAHNATVITNPILPGAHPDPSCIHVVEEDTFFCASSSFNIFPGIPIHASKDMVHWKLIGNVLNRPGQLPVLAESIGSTSGIWAPTLRLHNGTYYLVTTMVHDKSRAEDDPLKWENIIFETNDIWNESSWSNAVHFNFQGYDTSPWWDEEGESYIVGAHAWRVSPGIHLAKVDLKTGALKSNWTNIWNGTGGLAPEGPHFYKRDGYHYLMVAEGGTGEEHMETVARSKDLYGPYDPNPANPILTNANTTEYFQAVGHADLFQDNRGNWWGVSLAVRSGPEYKTWPMGRETILTNVTWTNGTWPVFQHPIKGRMEGWQLPSNVSEIPGEGDLADAPDVNLNFAPGSKLPMHFVHWRPPVPESYTISPEGHPNTLRLTPSKLNLTGIEWNSPGPGGQTFVGRRQTHTLFEFSFDIDFKPTTVEEETGITLFLSQNHHARLGLALLPLANTSTLALHLRFHAISYGPVPASFATPVPTSWANQKLTLQLRALNQTHYGFAAGLAANRDQGSFPIIPGAVVPGEMISWGFTGALLGAYATSNGGNGSTPSYVSRWDYRPVEQVRACRNGTLGMPGC